jgi:hypothetical protein
VPLSAPNDEFTYGLREGGHTAGVRSGEKRKRKRGTIHSIATTVETRSEEGHRMSGQTRREVEGRDAGRAGWSTRKRAEAVCFVAFAGVS